VIFPHKPVRSCEQVMIVRFEGKPYKVATTCCTRNRVNTARYRYEIFATSRI
jgi:hypothetical protein